MEVILEFLVTSAGFFCDERGVALEFFFEGTEGEGEAAGVPEAFAAEEVALSLFEARFFDEGFDFAFFHLDVTEACFGSVGVDAEGDERALFFCLQCGLLEIVAEGLLWRD